MSIKNTTLVAAAVSVVLCAGCGPTLGFLLSPSSSERPVPAEFDLGRNLKGNVLVVVDVAGSLPAQADLTEKLTSRIAGFLIKSAHLNEHKVIPYTVAVSGFSQTDPAELARQAGAEMVLYTLILDYELGAFSDGKYYTGMLVSRTALIKAGDALILWPAGADGREVHVAMDVETAGREKALDRLANAAAHCITRAFYNCPKSSFRITEERMSLNEMTEDKDF